MEAFQIFLVIICLLFSIRFLIKKLLIKKPDEGCGPDCGCH